MCIKAILLALAMPLLVSCGLQKVQATATPPAQTSLPAELRGKRIAVTLAFDSARIKGGHHEGLLQMRQPWFLGLKAEQRHLLYDNAGQVAALAFGSEVQNQGLQVQPEDAEFTLTGTVQTVTMNTYGHGSLEGFGSAGNYWEATVAFTDLRLTENRTGRLLWQGDQEGYAKLTPCPLHMDWGILKTMIKVMQTSVTLTNPKTVADPFAVNDSLHTFDDAYVLDEVKATPIEVAARQAAVAMLAKVAWPRSAGAGGL
jgi:hypothetical protein